VAAGANPVVRSNQCVTPLIPAADYGYADVVAFLLKQPAVKASIDHIDKYTRTALSSACRFGRQPVVQLLLDAGANPTIPTGDASPLNQATIPADSAWPLMHPYRLKKDAIAALLRHAIDEPNRARALHKARALCDAAYAISKTRSDARNKGETPAVQQQKALAIAPPYLTGRVEQNEPLPRVVVDPSQGDAQLRGVAEGVLALPREVFDAWVLGYLMPEWADKGPEEEEEEEEGEESG